MKKRYLVLFSISALVLGLVMGSIPRFRSRALSGLRRIRGKKTVRQRVIQHGRKVQERLLPDFQRIGVPYPASHMVLVGLKAEKQLQVWVAGPNRRYKLLRSYPILAASGELGPKLREGDLQVPEGLYRIESLNPNSRFHLALQINYPNAFDKEMARRDKRTSLGGDIMIHGSNCSIGCLAMGDDAAEDLFILAAETGFSNVRVILSPVDFRKSELPETARQYAWSPELYRQIKHALARLK